MSHYTGGNCQQDARVHIFAVDFDLYSGHERPSHFAVVTEDGRVGYVREVNRSMGAQVEWYGSVAEWAHRTPALPRWIHEMVRGTDTKEEPT